MKTKEELQQEVETLKFKIKQLEELNHWYIEQLKLRQKEKFAKSGEKGRSLPAKTLFTRAKGR